MRMSTTDKVRENRLRRVAARRGLHLEKSRRRDPNAFDYGTYWLIDHRTNAIAFRNFALDSYGLTLDDVESYLDETARRPEKGVDR
jgi:hypothetical protein